MENRFFNFIAPYLSVIDSGKFFRRPFSWLYSVIAIINLLLPFYLLYMFIEKGILKSILNFPANVVFVFIMVWLTIAVASWFGFQIWWDRKNKVYLSTSIGDDFVATPVFSHFIQTLGEWVGTWIALVGFVFALLANIILGREGLGLATLMLGREGDYLSERLGLGFLNSDLMSIILMPVYGFLIVIISRFFAEVFRALVAIANNTKKL